MINDFKVLASKVTRELFGGKFVEGEFVKNYPDVTAESLESIVDAMEKFQEAIYVVDKLNKPIYKLSLEKVEEKPFE